MDSPFPFIYFIFTVLSVLTIVQSSTIGVQYMSRLHEIKDREGAPPSVQVSAAYGVHQRLLPFHASAFEFRIITKVFYFSIGATWQLLDWNTVLRHVSIYWLVVLESSPRAIACRIWKS